MCFLILSTSKTSGEIVQAEMLGNINQPSQSQLAEGLYKGLVEYLNWSNPLSRFSGGINENHLSIWTISP